MKKTKNVLFLILTKPEDVPKNFITLSSVAEHLKTGVIYLFSTVKLNSAVLHDFEKCANDRVSVVIKFLKSSDLNRLDLLIQILRDLKEIDKILYISNECLALANLDELFRQSMQEKVLLCRKFDNDCTLDTNVILFNIIRWHSFCTKNQVSAQNWDAQMYACSGNLLPDFSYFSGDYGQLSPQRLNQIKILCFNPQKPWYNLSAPLGYLWWRRARQTRFYGRILSQNKKIFKSYGTGRLLAFDYFYQNEDKFLPLMKAYIKESFFFLFTFGVRAECHKKNLIRLRQQIIQKAAQ